MIILLILILIGSNTYAQTLVTRSSPGGTVDTISRELIKNTPIVIENRPGADGDIALENVINSKGNTYYIGQLNAYLKYYMNIDDGNKSINVQKEFDYVAHVGNVLSVIIIHPNVPVKTINQLIQIANTNPNTINFGTTGKGSTSDIVYRLLGNKFYNIPYKSSIGSHIDLISGQIDVTSSTVLLSRPLHKIGKIRIILKLFDEPLDDIKGSKNLIVHTNVMILSKKGRIDNKFKDNIVSIIESDKFKLKMQENGISVKSLNNIEYDMLLTNQINQWKSLRLIR